MNEDELQWLIGHELRIWEEEVEKKYGPVRMYERIGLRDRLAKAILKALAK